MKTLLALVFFPIIVVLVGMIAFGEILGYIIVAIAIFKLCAKKKR